MNEKEKNDFIRAWEEMIQAGKRFRGLFNSHNEAITKEDRQSFFEAIQLIGKAQETVSGIAENLN